MNPLESFVRRLNKLGIKVTFFANYPWIYLDTVNGIKVTGKYQAEHGFTAFWCNKPTEKFKYKITDTKVVFAKIREMIK